MAPKWVEMGLVMALVTMFWAGAAAQSGCTSALISLSPCLNYIQGNSSTPSSSCCSQLASVVKSSPQCLCTVLNGGGLSLGITINQTQALALPSTCNVQTPPVSQCNAAGGPTSLADSPAGTPTTTTPAGGGFKTVPSTGGDSSDGSTTALPISMLFFLLFVASYASTLTSF